MHIAEEKGQLISAGLFDFSAAEAEAAIRAVEGEESLEVVQCVRPTRELPLATK